MRALAVVAVGSSSLKDKRGRGELGEPVKCEMVILKGSAGPLWLCVGPSKEGAGGGDGEGTASKFMQDHAGEL